MDQSNATRGIGLLLEVSLNINTNVISYVTIHQQEMQLILVIKVTIKKRSMVVQSPTRGILWWMEQSTCKW